MAETSRFWDRLADRYHRQPIADEEAYRRKIEVTRSYFRPDMEILEFGCGTGGTAVLHAPHVKHIRAIDFSDRMLEIARERARTAGVDNVTFEKADITALSVPEASYDMVLGLSVLHLLKDPEAVMVKVYRMLKPGGLFVTSTACLGDIMPMMKILGPIGRALGKLPRLNVMTQDELISKFSAAGFEIAHRWHPGRDKAVFVIGRKPG